MDKLSYVAMLVAPFLLAVSLLFLIQQSENPLQNDYRYHQTGDTVTTSVEGSVKDRVSIMVILEVFALTLIIRPWQFPWRMGRFLIAEGIFLIWGALVIPMAMHSGRLFALHALGMMGLLGFVLPGCIVVLFVRDYLISNRS